MRGVLQGGYNGLFLPLPKILPSGGGGGSYNIGFDFWSSSGRGTLQGTDTYVLVGDTYPTSRGGATFGWVAPPLRYDDNTSETDSRLLSSALSAFTPSTFEVSGLPSGTYKLWTAIGEEGGRTNDATFKDGTTTILTVSGANDFYFFLDASGANIVGTSWASSGGGTPATVTINSGILNIIMAQSNPTGIAYLRLQKQ